VTAGDLVAAGATASAEAPRSTMAPQPELTKRPQLKAKGLEKKAPRPMAYSAPTETGEAGRSGSSRDADPYAGVGRNAPCPCGSGKKFKLCHGQNA
jgi:preprotein translocase subunit SecA